MEALENQLWRQTSVTNVRFQSVRLSLLLSSSESGACLCKDRCREPEKSIKLSPSHVGRSTEHSQSGPRERLLRVSQRRILRLDFRLRSRHDP